ncbi:MAG: phosphate/phosphite/phosphonate ABC transporter substrate-binding protein [Chloroflexota bacterium]
MHLSKTAKILILGILCVVLSVTATAPRTVHAQRTKIRFGVGPLQATPTATKAAFEPFFAWLANQLDVDYELTATDSWAGISVAMLSDQVDIAWMGPWGYVLANDAADVLTGKPITAIATVKYDEKPIYYAIIVGKPGLNIKPLKMEDNPSLDELKAWLDTLKPYSISFADLGSTSGYLVPTAFFRGQGIDPKTFFAKYSEGSTHAANETAVVNGQVDLATDFNRNRNTLIENGAIKADLSVIYWTSNPLPNDAIAIRPGLDEAMVKHLKEILLGLTPDKAKELMIGTGIADKPVHYTGFIESSDANYATIRKSGIFIGKIGARTRDQEPTAAATMAATTKP